MTTRPMTTPAGRVSWPRKIAGYAQLGKLKVYQHVYEWLLVVLLLDMEGIRPPGAVASLVLFLVAMIAVQAAACAADDIMGFRDGSDAENYRANDLLPVPRKLLPKPLLTGLLTEREAVAFAVAAALTATVAAVGSILVLDDVPPVAIVGYLVVLACAVQYSWGLKLSYRPGGLEFVIFLVNAATLLLPYWWIAGEVTTVAAVTSVLVGVWFLLVVGYGNAADRDGDAASGRRTFAVLAPPPVYRAYLVLLWVVGAVLAVLPFALRLLDPTGLLCVAPLLVMQALQAYWGVVRGDPRKAMKIGFRAVDVGGLGFALAILLS
jgi:1,4-dihydroxy-2-naphthoate polyprenyltransferase